MVALQDRPNVGAVVIINTGEDLLSPGIASQDDIRPLVTLVGAKAGHLLSQEVTQDPNSRLWVTCSHSPAAQVAYRLDSLSGMGHSHWMRSLLLRFASMLHDVPDPQAMVTISRALSHLDYPLQAKEALESTIEGLSPLEGAPSDLFNALGKARLDTGDFPGAAEAYRSALASSPSSRKSLLGVIKTQFLQGDILGAVKEAEAIGLEHLSTPTPEEEPDMYWLVGRELAYLTSQFGGGALSYDCNARPSFCCDRSKGSFPNRISSPDLFYTHIMVGIFLDELGAFPESLVHLKAALQLCPSSALALRILTATPVVFPSREAMTSHLAQVEAEVMAVGQYDRSTPMEFSPYQPFTITPSTMFIGYQGMGEHHLLAKISGSIPNLLPGVPTEPSVVMPVPTTNKGHLIRVGVASAFLQDHSVGRLMEGVLTRLPRDRFRVHLLYVTSAMWGPPKDSDPVAARLARRADEALPLPRNLTEAAALIAGRQLDILLFPELGMDLSTYALAYYRLAPVQATFWGHPVSQGLPQIDYIITSDLFEPSNTDRYTEQRVLFDSLSTFFPRPSHPPPASSSSLSPASFSLLPDAHIYLIGQTLMKFHPDFDDALHGIVEGDPAACFVITYTTNQKLWRVQLEARLRERLGNSRADHSVVFLPALPRERFYDLMRLAHVILDPYPFGGGVTSLEGKH